jgi:hypothetical protein
MGKAAALWPREYGAYAELVFPLLTAFVAGGASPSGAALAVSVVCWFLLSEPLAVLRGTRGRRVQDERSEPARRRAGWLTALGTTVAAAGVVLAPWAARLAALVPAGAAAIVLPAVLRGRPKALGAELVVATALSTMLLPVGVAGGMTLRSALPDVLVWLLTYWGATLAVHAVKARVKPELGAPWAVWAAPTLAVIAVLGGLAAAANGWVPVTAVLGLVPGTALVLAVGALRVHPRRLRRVGWSLVAANVVTLVVLVC